MDRAELATFLRGRRERISPADVGLPAGRRRRTPGLRREEVAQLAFISTEYYTRLEQARGPHPSREVLAGLARALRLSDAERDYLHQLVGLPPGPPPGPPREVRPSVQLMLDRLPQAAAFVTSATLEVIAWNALAAALMADFSAMSRRERNLARQAFLGPQARDERLYGVSDLTEFARSSVARLRVTAARYPGDPEVTALIDELVAGSPEFAGLWAAGDVQPVRTLRKSFRHPLVGVITVNCDALDLTDQDQQVVIYTADPGSSSEEALRLLSVIGTQRMEAAT